MIIIIIFIIVVQLVFSVFTFVALTTEVASHDEEAVRRVLPMLQTRLNESTDCLSDCITVKDSLTAW